jgi:hypothetical protein
LSPVLRQEIEVVTQHEVRLRGNVVLSTRAGNYRTVRGRTLLAAIIDDRPFGSVGIQKLAGKSKSRAQRGTKAIQPRKARVPASRTAASRQANSIRGPLARPRAFSAVHQAQPTNDLEKDLRWLFDRSRRRAA